MLIHHKTYPKGDGSGEPNIKYQNNVIPMSLHHIDIDTTLF